MTQVTTKPTIGLLHGPNLARLGRREPEIYGHTTLSDIEKTFTREAEKLGWRTSTFQSNCEGSLIDQIEKWTDGEVNALVVNPGALTHTSVALRDAIAASGLATVEVHISNIYQREPFRQKSLTAGVCLAVISGMGSEGYLAALRFLVQRANPEK